MYGTVRYAATTLSSVCEFRETYQRVFGLAKVDFLACVCPARFELGLRTDLVVAHDCVLPLCYSSF